MDTNSAPTNTDEYQFTADWFSQNIPVWTSIFSLLNPRNVLEIGAYEGRSTCFMIEHCSANHPFTIHSIDTWQGRVDIDQSVMTEAENRFDHNTKVAIRRAKNAVTLTKIKKFSNTALAELIAAGYQSKFDLAYIDGSHIAPDVLSDAVLAFQLVRVGGWMIFDDYLARQWPAEQFDVMNSAKPAVDAFVNIYSKKVYSPPGVQGYQHCIAKLSE